MTGTLPGPSSALTISFNALRRARTTLEDFAFSYFPYHSLTLPGDLLRFLDVLVWVEASIYQLDEDNEQRTGRGEEDPDGAADTGVDRICAVLREQGLLDDAVSAQLQQGKAYWRAERSICARLLSAPRPLQQAAALTGEEVLRAHEAKSFDYRVLSLLLFRLTGRPYDGVLLAFLRCDELLVDISDDLADYEDDVIANSFNIFRCYIHLYGKEAELCLVERISALEEEHGRLLTALPPAAQEHYWRRHREASDGQGADKWVFPRPIYDEEAYRKECGGEDVRGGAEANEDI